MSVCVVGEVAGVGAALSVKLAPGEIAVMRALFGIEAAAGPLMIMPTTSPVVFVVVTVVEPVVTVHEAMETGMPWIELPTVNLLASETGEQVTAVVAFSVQFVEPLAAKFSERRVT